MKKIETTTNLGFTAMRCSLASYVETSGSLGIELNGSVPFSVDAWVNLDGMPTNAKLLTKQDVFSLGLNGDKVLLEISGYPSIETDPEQSSIDYANWHYISITFDGSMVRLYIDGKFNFGQSISGTGKSNANPFQIASGMQGYVSSLRVYNQALDDDTVMVNMFEKSVHHLVANFDFTQAPPVDSGPSHLPLTLKGDAEIVNAVPSLALVGPAYAFPIEDTHVNPGGYQVDPYTVQAWVYIESIDNPIQVVFANADFDKDTGMALYLQYDSNLDGFLVISQRGENITANRLVSNKFVLMKEWHNIATVFTGTDLSIYIDGELDTTAPFGPSPFTNQLGKCLIGTGQSYGTPSEGTSLQGYISSVYVWSRALSKEDINQYINTTPEVQGDGISAIYEFSTSPIWNLVDQHPVGLAGGASISKQLSPASAGFIQEEVTAPFQELDSLTMEKLLRSVDLKTFAKDYKEELLAAMSMDLDSIDNTHLERHRAEWEKTIASYRLGKSSFRITMHTVEKERILLCHSARLGTYVAYRGNILDYDECTFWKINLVFTLVSGVIDAILGLRCYLTGRAQELIRSILTNARLTNILAMEITASIVWSFITTLFALGLLKSLVKSMIVVGFFTLLRVILRLVLIITGYGSATIIISLVVTAAQLIYLLSQRPTSCDPLPSIDLLGIKFNYVPTDASVGALPIRRNWKDEVKIPEWQKGDTNAVDSPAAYAISKVSNKKITIQAKFVISTNKATTVQITAEGGGILGQIGPVTTTITNGYSNPQYVSFELPRHKLGEGGVQYQDIKWTWYYRIGTGPRIKMTESSHRIYALLDTPTLPWVQIGDVTQLPWTDVMDFACEWAKGKKNADDAAAEVARKVNGEIGLTYDMTAGDLHYTDNSNFYCTDFIDFLKHAGGAGNIVNCVDCATIVTTFANILGCDLYSAQMGRDFSLNKIIAIGQTSWGYPNWGPGFSYHEVAWKNSSIFQYNDFVYDACLKVDNSIDPWGMPDSNRIQILPQNIAFTTLGKTVTIPVIKPFYDASYRERLATNTNDGISKCIPLGKSPVSYEGRRRIQ